MGTHPIFESDFDCLTDKGDTDFGSNMSSVLDAIADSPTPPPTQENEDNEMEVEEKPSDENPKEPEESSSQELEKPDLPATKSKRRPSEGTKATATPPTKRPRRSVPPKKKAEEETGKTDTPKKTKGKPKTPGRKKKEKEEDEDVEFLDCEYLKGEVIAVRNEEGGFYLAECVDNITAEDLERSEAFKVQWFDVTEDEDVFVRSYHDNVDHRTIVCERVKLKREAAGKWRIRPEMKKEVLRKLERALGGNPVTSSDDDLDLGEAAEVSLTGEKPVKKFTKKSKKTDAKKKSFARTPLGTPKPYLAKIPMSDSPRASLTMAAESSPPKPKTKKSDTPKRTPKTGRSGASVNQKKVY